MHRASVLLPTHDHALTLPYAVASVQAQGIDDIEILILGDGATEEVRAAVYRLAADDKRIRFFDLPKGPRRGEIHRDHVLRQAQGRIICYACDDDLWLPGHLQEMEAALEDCDFVGSMQVDVTVDAKVRCYVFDPARPQFGEPWLVWKPNELGAWANDGFGLSFGAHRLDAYRRLPEGWSTTPPGLPNDQFMWHKFKRAEWCRTKFILWPLTLHFETAERLDWSQQQRADEVARWSAIVASPDGPTDIMRAMLTDLADRLLEQSVSEVRRRADIAVEWESRQKEKLAALLAEHTLSLATSAAEPERLVAKLNAEQAARLSLEKKYEEMIDSVSWRLTAPLRRAVDAARRLLRRR